MSLLQYLKGVVCFLILTERMRFSVEFCVVKFSGFWVRFDGFGNKDWQEPKLGGAQGTPRQYSRTAKSLSLGMPRKASPLSSSSIGNFT